MAQKKTEPRAPHPITTRELEPSLWPQLERLFGDNGACGGCWCMYWRVARGEKWEELKGTVNKRRFKALVKAERAHGVLAFSGDDPVGWCSFDRRSELPRLDRARTLAVDDAERVWSIPCFFVRSGFRGQGVATALLHHALSALTNRGAEVVEAYPVRPKPAGVTIPAAFAWTGTVSLFKEAGFSPVGRRDTGKQRMRYDLCAPKAR